MTLYNIPLFFAQQQMTLWDFKSKILAPYFSFFQTQ